MKHKLTNNAGRRIGIPVRQAFVMNAGESRDITDKELAQMESNKITRRWMDTGILSVGGRLGEEHPEGEHPSEDPPKVSGKAKSTPKPSPKPQPKQAVAAADLPDGIKGEGIEYEHCGGGWYNLFVNGFKVTQDGKVRKDKAEEMAKDYE